MRILLVDHYDSFTYNLHQLLLDCGVQTDVVPCDDPRLGQPLPAHYGAIVLSPGPGRPDNARDRGLSTRLLDGELPVLGVCLGLQLICHHFGGVVEEMTPPIHGQTAAVRHDGDGLFRDIPDGFTAVRYHSLHCRLPPDLVATAWTEDGVLMAARHRTRPLWGVQFHPESACSQFGEQLLRNFLALAGRSWTPPLVRSEVPTPRPPPLRVFSRPLDTARTAEEVFCGLYGDDDFAYWLDSPAGASGEMSVVGGSSGPRAERVDYRLERGSVRVRDARGAQLHEGSIFDYLDEQLRTRWVREQVPFGLGYVGYFGYELKAEAGGPRGPGSDVPDASFLYSDRAIVFRHGVGVVLVCLAADTEEAAAWFDEVSEAIEALPALADPIARGGGDPRWTHDRARYREMIEDCGRQIRRGESYEICLTNRVDVTLHTDTLQVYRALRRANPAPYCAFFRTPEVTLLCSSPERFLHISADGLAQSMPIKGTSRRSADPDEDGRLVSQLATSVKERAENLMIVDLVRNDLGRVCAQGTVRVPSIFAVSTYQTVHQMVSTIEGDLRADVSTVDCVRACFPGGSMTGAPKVRTMEIIDRLEGQARGPYAGSFGYLSLTGAADLNILIRTMVVVGDEARIGVGGAIVDLSDTDAEIAEMELKAAAVLQTLAP